MKSEVLPQLPSKQRKMVILDPNLVKSKSNIMKNQAKQYKNDKSMSSTERRGVLLEWYHTTSGAKSRAVCDYLKVTTILYIRTELLSIFFSWFSHVRREPWTHITPWGWIFWTIIFYNLKNLIQDLSNEGSNFILSSLEVGHWVFWQITRNYRSWLLRIGQDSEFAKFWPRALTM